MMIRQIIALAVLIVNQSLSLHSQKTNWTS